MSDPRRIYLDNAATSWPKPEQVYRAVDHYLRHVGAPAGRSVYAEAIDVSRQVDAARQAVARLIGADDCRRVVFTQNGTDALNLALHGLLRTGDHVVTSVAEHNSVLRPLRYLEDARRIEVTRVGCDAAGVVDPDDLRRALRPATRLVVLTHASNVTGALQPVGDVGRIARRHGAVFLLDAAQTLGHLPWRVDDGPVDLVAAPGHKGLLGPLGTGFLYVGPGMEDRLSSIRQGGTGTQSEEDRQPDTLPDKYEAGNLNVPGIVGLCAGVEYLLERGLEEVRRHAVQLVERLLAGLADLPGVTLFGPREPAYRVGVVSIALAGYDPQEIAASLDAGRRIQARSGLHCAPLMHRALGTLATGGTVRFSIGVFNTSAEVDAAVEAVRQLAGAPSPVVP